jgi:phosphatidylglycerol---prolipoprotein diacylglyceryl transferase
LIPLKIVIDLEPNLFRLGPFLITWHGVFAVLGILAGARLGLWLLNKDGVDVSRGADGVAWMVVMGLIGARLLYVWENFKLYAGQLGRIFLITEGGISQWGGLFGAMVGVYIWARRASLSFWKIMDAAGAATMIGLAIGRIGDVINGEHHGTPTNLPWGVEYVNADTLGQPGDVVHPEVAYEMVLTLVLLGALLPFHQRLKARLPNGVLGLVYLGLYGVGRFWLSYFRTDPAVFAGLRQAQLASLLMVVIAVIAIPILYRRDRATGPADSEPEPAEPTPAEPEPMEPVAVGPEAAEVEASKPQSMDPGAAEPAPAEPEPVMPEPEAAEPTPEPVTPEPEAAEPEPAEPEPVVPEPAAPPRRRKPRRPKSSAPASTPIDPSND